MCSPFHVCSMLNLRETIRVWHWWHLSSSLRQECQVGHVQWQGFTAQHDNSWQNRRDALFFESSTLQKMELSPFTQTILIALYSLPPDHFFPAFDLPPKKKAKNYSTPTVVTPKHLKDMHLQSQFLFHDLLYVFQINPPQGRCLKRFHFHGPWHSNGRLRFRPAWPRSVMVMIFFCDATS